MNCARWDLCGGYWVTDIPTAICNRNGPSQLGNPAVRKLDTAGSAKWRSRPVEPSVPPIGADVLFRSEL